MYYSLFPLPAFPSHHFPSSLFLISPIGMSAVNDLEGCTYMSQSLPFGGCKKSGYDRFAGPEGEDCNCMPTLRDYTVMK